MPNAKTLQATPSTHGEPTDNAKSPVALGKARGRPKSLDLRTRVLQAAVSLCAELGPNDFSLEGVAARAGVSRASIYRNWRDRRLLLETALLDALSSISPPLELPLETAPLEILKACYGVVSRITTNTVGQAMLRVVLEREAQDFATSIKETFYHHVYEPFISALAHCQSRDEIDPGISVETLCWMGISMGLFHVAVLHTPFTQEMADEMAQVVARGIKTD